MTVPSLMQNYQRQSYVTQLHKVYNEVNQALLRYQTDKNAVNLKEAGLNSNAAVRTFIKNYFRVIQDCPDAVTPCLASEYKKLDGTISTLTRSAKCMTLASGVSLCPSYPAKSNILIQLGVDINGQKGPNIVGRDFFLFYIYNNGVIDDLVLANPDTAGDGTWSETASAPLSEDERELNFQKSCKSSTAGFYHGCLGKILNDNWQMTY